MSDSNNTDSSALPRHVIARFEQNDAGRDFVVGDIHGMFDHLEALLEEVDFQDATDRLFSVGDLVDRGPRSSDALRWLGLPWFHACRGNHEQFALDSLDPDQCELWVASNGGRWWLELTESEQREFRAAFGELPFALEIMTRTGLVGIVHADVPPFVTWERFMELLDIHDRDAMLYALWSRNRLSAMTKSMPVGGGVERIYCGHTPTRATVKIGNVHYIDTGAVYSVDGYEEARLTLVQIHPERHLEYSIRTAEPRQAKRSFVR